MKRFFIFLSSLILAVFLGLSIGRNKDILQIMQYSGAALIGTASEGRVTNREDFISGLEKLAQETDSLIVQRVVEPTKDGTTDTTNYTYVVYGDKEIPSFLKLASQDSARTSPLVANYFIVSGNLSAQALSDRIVSMGYSSVPTLAYTLWPLLLNVAGQSASFIALAIFFLAFLSLTLIYRVKDLRFAGIRLISGESLPSVMFRSFKQDSLELGLATLLAFGIGLGTLASQLAFQAIEIKLLAFGLALYALMQLSFSFVLSLIYLVAVRQEGLVALLKGKLPLKRLMGLMLCGQLLAVLVIGFSGGEVKKAYAVIREKESAQTAWENRQDLVKLIGSWDFAFKKEEEFLYEQDWLGFARSSLEQGAIYVRSNVANYYHLFVDEEGRDIDGNRLSDYTPAGNTLQVSPSYLEKEGVPVSPDFLEQMKHLKQGQYGLVLPESLRSDEAHYKQVYLDHLRGYARETLSIDSPEIFETELFVTYVPDGQSYFLYNLRDGVETQYLQDSILVVLTPESTGDTPNSRMLWAVTPFEAMSFKGYDQTIALLKQHDLYDAVAYVYSSYLTYLSRLQDARTAFISLIFGTVLGFATSILLFNAMVLMYFEQFRREIFIKRLAGLGFTELHRGYLMAQAATLFLGFLVLSLLTKQLVISGLTLTFFLLNALVILYRQHKKDEQVAITVLKGQ